MKKTEKKWISIVIIIVVILGISIVFFVKPATTTAVVNTQTLKVREEPTENGNIITLLPEGTVLNVVKELDNGFTQIELDGSDAYVMTEYISNN